MAVTVLVNAPHQDECGAAVTEGLRKIGVVAKYMRGFHANTDCVVCWGWRNGQRLQAEGKTVLVMERAYWADRFKWFSLGWNGLNGRAMFMVQPDDGARARKYGLVAKPWKTGGEYVLIAGQTPGDMSLAGRNLFPWYQEVTRLAKERYGLPVRYRPHPNLFKRGIPPIPEGAIFEPRSLEEDLEGAAVCITWNSNTSVDAVLAGVPTVTIDEGSMAWDVSAHVIGEYSRPDRDAWIAKLAWCQWRLDEIASGEPFVSADFFRQAAESSRVGALQLHSAA